MVIPGSHKRDVVWNPRGAWQNQSGNTRWADMDDEARSLFVELTGKAGTAIIFTHDIIHQSYHEADSYRRVVHLTYDHGDRPTSCELNIILFHRHVIAASTMLFQLICRENWTHLEMVPFPIEIQNF